MEFHLYEIVLENPVMWVKIQASCKSHWQANAMLEARFGGTTNASPGPGYLPQSFSVPIRLSEYAEWVMNWNAIEHQLPDGWDDHEFRLVEGPYPWCESLSDGCVCYGMRGRLDATYVSDFGLHDEEGRRNRKSQNARALHHNKEAEESFARQDESAREQARKRHEEYLEEQRSTRQITSPHRIKYVSDMGLRNLDEVSGEAVRKVNGLTAGGFYCQIDRKYHPYDGQAKQRLMSKALALTWQPSGPYWPQLSTCAPCGGPGAPAPSSSYPSGRISIPLPDPNCAGSHPSPIHRHLRLSRQESFSKSHRLKPSAPTCYPLYHFWDRLYCIDLVWSAIIDSPPAQGKGPFYSCLGHQQGACEAVSIELLRVEPGLHPLLNNFIQARAVSAGVMAQFVTACKGTPPRGT